FKARGAFYAVKHLIEELGIEEVRRRGVVTHSSGMVYLAENSLILVLLTVADNFDLPRKPCPGSGTCRFHLLHPWLHRHAYNLHTVQDRRDAKIHRPDHFLRLDKPRTGV